MTYTVSFCFFNVATRKFKMIYVVPIAAEVIFPLASTELENLNIFHPWGYTMVYPRHILCFIVLFIPNIKNKVT